MQVILRDFVTVQYQHSGHSIDSGGSQSIQSLASLERDVLGCSVPSAQLFTLDLLAILEHVFGHVLSVLELVGSSILHGHQLAKVEGESVLMMMTSLTRVKWKKNL